MMLNATFNDISTISWWSVLLVDKIGVPRETHKLLTVNFTLYIINVCIREEVLSYPIVYY